MEAPIEAEGATLLEIVRRSRGLSCERLARIAGLTKTTVEAIERREVRPNTRVRDALERALGVPFAQLVLPAAPLADAVAIAAALDPPSVLRLERIRRFGPARIAAPAIGIGSAALRDAELGATASSRDTIAKLEAAFGMTFAELRARAPSADAIVLASRKAAARVR